MTANVTITVEGDFYETHIAYRLTLIHSTCSSNLQSKLYVTYAHTNCTISLQEGHFPTPLRHIENQNFY